MVMMLKRAFRVVFAVAAAVAVTTALRVPSNEVLASMYGPMSTSALELMTSTPKQLQQRYAGANSQCPHTFEPQPQPLPAQVPATLMSAMKSIDEQLAAMTSPSTIPGIAWTVFTGEKTLFEGMHGAADWTVSPPVPPTRDTLWRVASVTKALSTHFLADVMASSHGALHWDTPVAQLYPDFKPPNPWNEEPIRLRHLASQMSGLARESWCDGTLFCDKSLDQIVSEEVNVFPLLMPPDSWPSYSNLGFSLLGNILVQSQHLGAFDLALTNWLHTRLGMTSSGAGSAMTPELMKRLAPGYVGTDTPFPYMDQHFNNPCGGAFSSIADLRKWISALLVSDPSDAIDLRRLEQQFMYLNPDVGAWGTPWETWMESGYMLRNKGGNLPGATTLVSMIPELNVGVVMTANAGADEFAISHTIWSQLIPALTDTYTQLRPEPEKPSKPMDAYTGVYEQFGTGVQFSITADGNVLRFGSLILRFFDKDNQGFRAEAEANLPVPCTKIQFASVEGANFYFANTEDNTDADHFDLVIAPGLLMAAKFLHA